LPANADSAALTAAQEWRRHWLLVLSALAGLTVATLPTATLGMFMQPLADDFGWTRTQVTAGLTMFALVSMPLIPFAGVLIDRFGPRRIAVPGLLVCGACFAAFGLMSGPYWQWILIWLAYTLASLMICMVVWTSAVSNAFTASRGLALAVVLCGAAVATGLAPTVTRLLMDQWGWRGAYIGIGAGWAGLAFVLVLLFFHDRRRSSATSADGDAAPQELPGGLTLGQAMRSATTLRIGFAMFVASLLGSGVLVHIVPLLAAKGLPLAQATTMVAMMGGASIVGKLVTGWLMDRLSGSLLPTLGYAGPAISCALLLQDSTAAWLPMLAMVVLGYCMGASLQLGTYLTTRYAGLRNFGAIFGVFASLMGVGGGLGPLLAGGIFDATGGYALMLTGSIPLAIMAGLAVFRLGPYPVFAPEPVPLSRQSAPA
jgi:MFS family permease